MKILHKIRKFHTYLILWTAIVIFVSISLFSFNIKYNQVTEFLNSEIENISLKCHVSSYPKIKEGTVSFCGEIEECEAKILTGKKIYVTMSKDIPEVQNLAYRDIIGFKALPESATPLRNPGGFDFESYVKGLGCVGSVYISKDAFESHTACNGNTIYKFRRRFIQAVDKYFLPKDGAMIKAIVSGDRDEMDEETAEALKRSGVYHIVAISGLHLNLFTCVVAFIIGKLKMRRLKKALLSFGACLGVSVLVLIFTGFGVSVWRAFIMMMVFCFSAIVSRDYSAKNSLFVSAFVILLTMPYSFWSVSFRLSFLSTLAVLVSIDVIGKLVEKGLSKSGIKSQIVQTLIVSLMTILFTLPVTMTSFGYITLHSWIANLFVLYVVPFLLSSGVLFAFAASVGLDFIAEILSYGATTFSRAIIFIAQIVSQLPGATIDVNAESVVLALCLALTFIITLVVTLRSDRRKSICVILIFVIAWSTFLVYNSDDDKIRVTFADVGQGDSAIIQTHENCIMIDCGTMSSETYTASEVEGILQKGNTDYIDLLIVSHFHKDHVNIIPKLLERGIVKNLVLPRYYDFIEIEAKNAKHSLVEAALRSDTSILYVSEGSVFSADNGLKLEFLSPSEDMFEQNNELSAVVKVTYGKNSMLFCGDIEEAGMENLLTSDIDCDIMKIAHHGGESEKTRDFLKVASPEYAVISCGENNTYNHPDENTVEDLNLQGCKIFRTDKNGAITVTLDKEKILNFNTMR